MAIKSSCKKLVNQIKNKGGRAFIYKFNKTFRLILMLKHEDIARIRVKFSAEDKAELFARRMLTSQRIELALDRHNPIIKSDENTYYHVDWRAYKKSRVFGHDDLCLSYWYQLGSGRAFRNTSSCNSSWVT
jgi:hypothetical protein